MSDKTKTTMSLPISVSVEVKEEHVLAVLKASLQWREQQKYLTFGKVLCQILGERADKVLDEMNLSDDPARVLKDTFKSLVGE
ncbi:MAG: hypothetical protein QXO47_10455 [Thermoproteota archaeon]